MTPHRDDRQSVPDWIKHAKEWSDLGRSRFELTRNPSETCHYSWLRFRLSRLREGWAQ